MTAVRYDAVVVGAGIVGVSAAYHLSKTFGKVLLIDQYPVPHARGSSHGHSRVVRFAYRESVYNDIMADAFRLWSELEREVHDKLIVQTGGLYIAKKGSLDLKKLEANLIAGGMPYEYLEADDLSRRYPMFTNDGDTAAILEKTAGFIQADKAHISLLNVYKKMGGIIKDQTKLISIDIDSNNSVLCRTNAESFYAERLVITAGPWSKDILKMMDIELPLRTVQVASCYWREVQNSSHTPEKMPVFIEYLHGPHSHVYGIPTNEYPGQVKVCFHSGIPTDPDNRPTAPDASTLSNLSQYVKVRLPLLDYRQPSIVESCIYTLTPDSHCIIDRHPNNPRIAFAAGMSGTGFKHSIVVGKLLTEMVSGKKLSHDITFFSSKRFTQQKSML